MPYAKFGDTKVGDVLITDGGFTCMKAGEHVVQEDDTGLFIPCTSGKHYIVGQVDDPETGEMIGLTAKVA